MQALQRIFVDVSADLASHRDDDRGATAVEYGLIVALIAAVIIAGVALLGTKTQQGFTSVTVNYPS